MKASPNCNLDRAIYWPLHALIISVLFGTVADALLNGGAALGRSQWVWLTFGMAFYYIGFLLFNLGREKFPRVFPVIFFSLQWTVVFGMMTRVPGNFLWLLALPVVAQSVRFGWPAMLVVSAAFLGTIMGLDRLSHRGWGPTVSNLLSIGSSFAFVIVFTLATARAIRAQKRSEELTDQLELANAQLRTASEQAAALAAANERNRIARDIHDGLGHSLTVIAVQLQIAQTLIGGKEEGRASAAIARAEELSRRALDEVRTSVSALRIAPIVSLPTALAGLVQQSGMQTSLEVKGTVRALPDEAEQALFRAVQEGLTNVRKHAQATRVVVVLDYEAGESVAVSITDDGRGNIDVPAASGFGLSGIGERASRLGGKMMARNHETGGFALRVEIPA